MGLTTFYVYLAGDDADLTPEELASARRRRYMGAKVSEANLSLWLYAARLGFPKAVGNEKEFYDGLALDRQLIEELGPEFAGVPETEAEIKDNIRHVCKKLVEAINEFLATQNPGVFTIV